MEPKNGACSWRRPRQHPLPVVPVVRVWWSVFGIHQRLSRRARQLTLCTSLGCNDRGSRCTDPMTNNPRDACAKCHGSKFSQSSLRYLEPAGAQGGPRLGGRRLLSGVFASPRGACVRVQEELVIVATGPLTAVADALAADKEGALKLIGGVYIQGSATASEQGWLEPSPEASNLREDMAAARAVFAVRARPSSPNVGVCRCMTWPMQLTTHFVLQTHRAFGDGVLKGVRPHRGPLCSYVTVKLDPAETYVLIISSDGVWNVIRDIDI